MKKIYITNENRDLIYHKTKNLWFEEVSDNIYTIHSDLDYILEYCRIIFDSKSDSDESDFEFTDVNGVKHNGNILAFDPAGGPYIGVGSYKINGKTLKRIFVKDNTYFFMVE